ncbi:hypothetical protein HGRIS_011347 [Hohenbuehelia grisea]|uniref:Uncharacterized protein n=1 Tax=Hohenbuehelia grisea TaxID=104357 RepID=A0ABR3JUS9_9AGAR
MEVRPHRRRHFPPPPHFFFSYGTEQLYFNDGFITSLRSVPLRLTSTSPRHSSRSPLRPAAPADHQSATHTSATGSLSTVPYFLSHSPQASSAARHRFAPTSSLSFDIVNVAMRLPLGLVDPIEVIALRRANTGEATFIDLEEGSLGIIEESRFPQVPRMLKKSTRVYSACRFGKENALRGPRPLSTFPISS